MPRELDSEKTYTSDSVSYQDIEKAFTSKDGWYEVKGLYFNRDDLKKKNLIK